MKVLHAGTKRVDDSIVTNGGRVLGVTAPHAPLERRSSDRTYGAIAGRIHFDGMHYREDIAARPDKPMPLVNWAFTAGLIAVAINCELR